MRSRKRNSLPHSRALFLIFLLPTLACWKASAQDWVRTGTNLGAARIRLAAADFNPSSADAQTPALKTTFDNTLYNDLNNAGIFDMVSKSMAPPLMPASPQQMNLAPWAAAPSNAAFVAFGSISAAGDRLAVYGWLFDAKNPASPQILGKQYNEAASQDNARLIAHRFADEIITRLGGGVSGIAETHIYYIAARGGNKEVWQMDYDGQGAHQITHLGTISLSPRVSPDNDRIAFASLGRQGWSIRMFSLVLGRMVSFPSLVGNTLSPAWSSDGAKLAFSASRSGDPEIFTSDASGGNVKQVTTFRGPDVSPTWNPKTNSQIAWCSGRTGLPQIYIMGSDGTGVQRMTDGGYATSPSWSPADSFWRLPGTASMVREPLGGRTSTSWTLPANAGLSSRMMRGGRIFPRGLQMGGTSSSNARTVADLKFGQCFPMAPNSIA